MKPIRTLPERLLAPFKALRAGDTAHVAESARSGKGQSLLRLHEYQHRVLVEIFKVSMAGFGAFIVVLLGLSVYCLLHPLAPAWMALTIGTMAIMLGIALSRTVKDFRIYRRNYEEITATLRAKLLQQARLASVAQGSQGKVPVEHRLLSALKPKEHSGWDGKSCGNCRKTIELLATVCQHCGHEQESPLVN